MKRAIFFVLLGAAMHLAAQGSASGQVLAPTDKEQFVGVFLYKPSGTDGWVGAVSSRATREIVSNLELAWQFDYGSLGALQITPTGKPPLKETSVSKNSGQFTLGYWNGKLDWTRPFGWRFGANGGLEHKRTQPADSDQTEHTLSPVAGGEVVVYGNRLLGQKTIAIGGGKAVVPSHTLDWTIRTLLTTALAVESDGEHRRGFVDPKAEAWWSVWPVVNQQAGAVDFFRFVVRFELAGLMPLGNAENRAHWDASASTFITKPIGFMVRRFEGYFDHNLRDRKEVTSVMLVARF